MAKKHYHNSCQYMKINQLASKLGYLKQSQQQFGEVSWCVSCYVFLQLFLKHFREK